MAYVVGYDRLPLCRVRNDTTVGPGRHTWFIISG